MRTAWLRFLVLLFFHLAIAANSAAQNGGIATGLNHSVVNLACNQNCITQSFRIPHLRGTSDYTFSQIAYNPYPYVTAGGAEDPNLYNDDNYSYLIPLPFPFCFYDSVFTSAVIGSNGLLTFDPANASCANAFTITQPIPYQGGTICQQGSTYYPQAAIMAAYSDLDPRLVAGPADRKIEWRTEGVAPFRRFVASYYHIGVFSNGGNACSQNTPNTFQIVIYESTGIVEIYVQQKACLAGTSGGRAIMGIQDWTRTRAVAAPGKNNTVWFETNTAYRFTPAGNLSRFVGCDVLQLDGTLIAHGDTITNAAGFLDVTFPNFCQATASGQYIIRSTYGTCDNLSQIVLTDTITVNKTTSLNATVAVTPTTCGAPPGGTATVTVPAGIGTAPYTFILNPGAHSLTGNSPQQFTGLAAGTDTITVVDASGGCHSNIPVTITATGSLTVNFTVTPTSCFGNTVSNGGLVVQAPNGTAPYTYTVNHPIAPVFTITQANNGTFNTLLAGNYLLTVKDSVGCQATDVPFTVASGPQINPTFTTNPTTCPGANDGSITITGTDNGTAPYQYFLNALSYPGNVITNLAPGSYFISMTDATGCQTPFVQVPIVDGVSGVTGTAVATNTSCAGSRDGKITVTATSGTGPYQYSINNGATWQASNVFTGLATGTYNAMVKEGVCTSGSITVAVLPGPGLQTTLAETPATCAGAHDGRIQVTMNSGTAPYTWVLDGLFTQTAAAATITFANVVAGSHSVTATDINGCITTSPATIVVTAGPGFTASFTSTPTTCAGANNGKIQLAVQNPGTAPFAAVLSPGNITLNSATSTIIFNNLAPGNYSALITDANGCQYTVSNMSVTAGPGLTASAVATATTCPGVNNGSVLLTMTSGTAPYTGILDGVNALTSATASINFVNLTAGTHQMTVTDANGCVTSAPLSAIVPAGTGYNASFVPTPTSCAGAMNGKLVITPEAPGTAPYTILVNPGGLVQTSANASITFSNLAAGTYSALITDANGCQKTINNMVVDAGSPLNAIPAALPTSCNGANNGSITVQAPGNGLAPYSYSLNGGAPQPAANFNGLAAGSYTIVVNDAGGCTSGNLNAVVTAGPPVSLQANRQDVLCFGTATGSLHAVPSANATNPVQYSLDNVNWQASQDFTGLVAGNYSVYIVDALGCRNFTDITIGQPAALQATASPQAVRCHGANDGQVLVSASGGTPAYQYSLDNINFQPGNSFSVAAGSYTAYVRDGNGCVIAPIPNIVVTQPAVLAAAAVTANASCDGGSDGQISLTATGGVAPYDFSINGGGYQGSGTFNLGPGTYQGVVRDANGCLAPVAAIVVGLTNNLTFTPMTDLQAICEGTTANLQITSNATQYAWDHGQSLSSATVANPTARPAVSTLYTVTATLGRCSIIDDVYVPVLPAPVPDAGPDGDICFGQAYQLQGSGGISFEWSPAGAVGTPGLANPTVAPGQTTTYFLHVTDNKGCRSLNPDPVVVKVTPPIRVVTSPVDTIVAPGVQIPLLATSAGTNYLWTKSNAAGGLSNPFIRNPVATAPLTEGEIVTYTVRATTSAGCYGFGTVTVRVYKGPELYVPSAFTPNGDGQNDFFTPFPVGIRQLNYFRVYNRWGRLMYLTQAINNGWDGKLAGVDQPAAVYVWIAEAVTVDNRVITRKGTVTLVR